MRKIKLLDRSEEFSSLVSFGTNKYNPVHRWYPFVEGYSKEFVRRIIGEQERYPEVCFDPFGGVGTTSLTCQELGVKCISFENNPFFSDISKCKLRDDYKSYEFEQLLGEFRDFFGTRCRGNRKYPDFESKTFFESRNLEKWIFDRQVANGILDIVCKIDELEKEESKYATIFKLALGSLLVSFSNVYRNGKCLAYRKDWQNISRSRKDVQTSFLNYCKETILIDIRTKENLFTPVHNYIYFKNGDSRSMIKKLEDSSIDIVITSPPYLNSRDYTDIYRLELWILGYVGQFSEEQSIRKSALTSHVQITLDDFVPPDNRTLSRYLEHIAKMNGSLWNKNIPNMIKGYFHDMHTLFRDLRPKLKKGASVYINVSNSAYGGKICEVDKILSELAENNGFITKEIRIARYIGSSRQQNLNEKLRESIIVLKAK